MARKSYEQIQRQIEALQAAADKLRRKEVDEVIGRIRQAIDHYGLTAADLGLGRAAPVVRKKKAAAGRAKAAPKASPVAYRNEAGQTWAGRGKRPQWLRDALEAGHTLDEFRVNA
ncbi:MAG: H-NS histone family protein [Proteobacteria bacterium]|nr:H-NS histone family protein [Pseudomonadota bacterium]